MCEFVVISIHKVSFSVPHLVIILLDFSTKHKGWVIGPCFFFFQKQISQKTWKHWINACICVQTNGTVETFNLFHKIKAGLTQLLAPP